MFTNHLLNAILVLVKSAQHLLKGERPLVTIRDIAKQSGVSAATVSRLLNNDPSFSISDDTKKRILDVAHDLGYDRKEIALPQRNIAVFFAITPKEELEDIYFNNLRKNIYANASKKNMQVTFYHDLHDFKNIAQNMDGFIAVGSFKKEFLDALSHFSKNGVFIDSNPRPTLFNSVQPDMQDITVQAIDAFRHNHLTKLGFIGGRYYNPDTGESEPDEREKIFRHYLGDLGLLNEAYIYSDGHFSVDTGYKLGNLVATNLKNDLPDGFFIASDPIAVGVLQAFNEHNISVPMDTSLISVNDIDVAKYVSPPLSTFHIDIAELSRVAINMISDSIISGSQIKRRILLNSQLIIRKSFIPQSTTQND